MSDNDDARITSIIHRLDSLTLEANTLTRELKTLRSNQQRAYAPTATARATARNPPTRTHEFEIGDRVIITNTYQGSRGTKGTVTYITDKQITLIDEKGKRHTRKYTNLRRTV
jgi:hypothetical protein